MKVSVFPGDITDAPADVICTSTNARLSLMMGTGAAVREKGGFEILRECERIVEAATETSGKRQLRTASVHVTTAGSLSFKAVIHCVASNESHLSSPDVVRVCTKNALIAAESLDAATVAMPVFASGHARVKFDRAVQAMAEALRDASTTVQHVIVAVIDRSQADEALRVIREVFPEALRLIG